jgi:pimeloyl-ACP methyl ester carboxylesterase/DNA-binding winged helix-turn-helix (wHTH) protein
MTSAAPQRQPGNRVPRPAMAFGAFVLDPANQMLTRDGRPIRLRPKTFAMLAYLVAAAGRLVTKKDLLDDLWRDVFVGDDALKTCMREIREALGDDVHQPRYVETVHRRGYRFIAAIADAGAAASIDTVFRPPGPQYVQHGDATLAYQVVGSGPIDIVFATSWLSHLDCLWSEPSFACFLARLASFARLILFDVRGTGLSTPSNADTTPASRVADMRAIMDAAGSRRAALVGVSDGGTVCSLFAAAHPERTRALVMFGAYASGTATSDYPWTRTERQHREFEEEIVRDWGGPVGIGLYAPSRAADPRFRAWWSHYLQRSAPPETAAALARMNAGLDVRRTLAALHVPTLVLHRRGDRVVLVEAARDFAARIAGARLVALPGHDHLPFLGDQDAVVNEIERFLSALAPRDERAETLISL